AVAHEQRRALAEALLAVRLAEVEVDVDHRGVEALVVLADDVLQRHAEQPRDRLPLAGAEELEELDLRQLLAGSHERHGHQRAVVVPGAHRGPDAAVAAMWRASASIVPSRPTRSTSATSTPHVARIVSSRRTEL